MWSPCRRCFSALLAAIVWNLFTWWLGLPSSSSHALVGGLCGAALASADGSWAVLKWSLVDAKGAHNGLWPKIVLPMVTSPTLGFFIGALLMLAAHHRAAQGRSPRGLAHLSAKPSS